MSRVQVRFFFQAVLSIGLAASSVACGTDAQESKTLGSGGARPAPTPTSEDGFVDAPPMPNGGAGSSNPDIIADPQGPPTVPASGWPGPRFNRRIGANSNAFCVLTPERSIRCYGSSVPSAPKGEFHQVTVGITAVCGLRRDGGIACEDRTAPDVEPPDGKFTRVEAGERFACALDKDGMVTCWGEPREPAALDVPQVAFQHITLTHTGGCGVTREGQPLCWGSHLLSSIEPNRTDYTALYAGTVNCGLFGQGQVDCLESDFPPPVPPGEGFVLVESSGRLVCALHASGALHCNTSSSDHWAASHPTASSTRFEEVVTSLEWACGITTDLTVRCWGDDPPDDTVQGNPISVLSLEDADDLDPCDDDPDFTPVQDAASPVTGSIEDNLVDDPLMPDCSGHEDGYSVFKLQGHIHGHPVDLREMSGSQLTSTWFKSSGLELRSSSSIEGQAASVDTGTLQLPADHPLGAFGFVVTRAELLSTPLEQGTRVSWRISGIRQDKGPSVRDCPTPELPVALRGCQYRSL